MKTQQAIQNTLDTSAFRRSSRQILPLSLSDFSHQPDTVRFQASAKPTSAQHRFKKWLFGLTLLPSLILPSLAYSQPPTASYNGRLSAHTPALVEEARKSDVIPGVQTQVHQKLGWTGKGVRVHLIDQFFVQDNQANAMLNNLPNALLGSDVIAPQITHGHDMTTLIRSVAPDVSVTASDMKTFVNRGTSVFPDLYALKLKDDMKTLDDYIVKQSARQLDVISAEFETLAKLPDAKRPHLVNMSMGLTMKALMEHLQADLYQVVASGGQFVLPYPKYRDIVLGKDANSQNVDARRQRIGMYLEVLLLQDVKAKGPFAEALKRYEAACKTLREKGTLIIVAVGNDGDSYPNLVFTEMGPAKFRQNMLSMNPYVLPVGALDNNQTPDDPRDDKASAKNSPGPVGYLMSGTKVMISRPNLGQDVLAGSSCSSALTSGMAALLVQKMQAERNPLTAETLQQALVASGETISVAPNSLELAEVSSKTIPAYSPPRLVGQLK